MRYLAKQIVYLIAQFSKLLKTLQEFCNSEDVKIHELTDFKKTLTFDHYVIFSISQARHSHIKWSL